MAGNLKKKRSLTPDVLKASNRSTSGLSESLEHAADAMSVTTSVAGSDVTSQRSEQSSPMNTPQTSKRVSMNRKLRPKSEMAQQSTPNRSTHSSGEQQQPQNEADSNKLFTPDWVWGSSKFQSPSSGGTASSSTPTTALNNSDLQSNNLHLNGSRGGGLEMGWTVSEDTVPELPSSTTLQHLGKARPKRTKKHAPSRGAITQR